ncbi:hypothetical protein J8M20_09745 [Pseudoalteromonas luteoviolacea]|uniref:hypothetical protein n=1 Tax=Pseudoalteromonas luteoviolacea TaxID=43657 RepID=UPI001B378083|nr:hypothetical protein [Pseudoalteromonas luteoviolacea]MBQ4811622.1 hypothetical protein [Pseudoalteromonas luteoviolacea]
MYLLLCVLLLGVSCVLYLYSERRNQPQSRQLPNLEIYPRIVANDFIQEFTESYPADTYVTMFSAEGQLFLVAATTPDEVNPDDVASNHHTPVLAYSITESLSAIFVMPEGDVELVLSNSHIKALGLHRDELLQLAKQNMAKFAREQNLQHTSIYNQECGFVTANGTYESSLILCEPYIEGLKKHLGGKLHVFIPVTNSFICTGEQSQEAMNQAKQAAERLYEQSENKLINKRLSYVNGTWQEH